jgi:capsular exopolysaccharide synthesis family protein
MNRIQQILEKAERDETVRGVSLREVAVAEAATAPYGAPERHEPNEEAEAVDGPFTAPAGSDARDFAVDGPDRDAPDSGFDASRSASRVSIEARPSPLLVATSQPASPAAEQYRSLRSRISRAQNDQGMQVIQITSPGGHDGKTVTALNLALTMAQEFQRRVLIVDTDLRRPAVHEMLGLPAGPGLVDVLTGDASLEEALIEIPEYRLTVLRAGRTYDRSAEMLGSAPMRRLMDTLRSEFDRIVVDSAPTTVTDPVAVLTLADSVILVVREGTTTKPAIARAVSSLGTTKLLGMVFNASTAPQQPHYATTA